MNRSLSVRSRTRDGSGSQTDKSSGKHHRFTMSSLRGIQQPDLSKKLYKLIKAENHAIGAYENAAKQQAAIASQLSDWGEETGDDAISDVSDKLGVLLAEIAEQEDVLAQGLEDSRSVLKQIRNTESSVQPSRDQKAKIQDEIQKLKYKEPSSTKIVILEQELVRAEAQSLVAEAQLTNITRQKFKEAYDLHTAAIIERAEKQILLAKNARKLLNLLDDTPVVPGDVHQPFEHGNAAREVLNMAEDDLRSWAPNLEPIRSNAGGLGSNAMPTQRIGGDSISSGSTQQYNTIGTQQYNTAEGTQQYNTTGSTQQYTTTEPAQSNIVQEPTSMYERERQQEYEQDVRSTSPTTSTTIPYNAREQSMVAGSTY